MFDIVLNRDVNLIDIIFVVILAVTDLNIIASLNDRVLKENEFDTDFTKINPLLDILEKVKLSNIDLRNNPVLETVAFAVKNEEIPLNNRLVLSDIVVIDNDSVNILLKTDTLETVKFVINEPVTLLM